MPKRQVTKTEQKLVDSITDERNKYQKLYERQSSELSTLKIITNNLRRQNKALTIDKLLEDKILDAFKAQLSNKSTNINQSNFFCDPKRKKTYAENAVLILSDLHISEQVNNEEIDGLNHYNFDILNYRLNALYEGIANIIKNGLEGYTLESINLILNGDLVTGTIHDELMETNEFIEVEAVILAQKVISEYILSLRHLFPVVNVFGVSGNHGRLTKNVRYKRAWNNWDYLIMKMVESRLDGLPGINFSIPKATTQTFHIGKHKVYIDHGFGIRSWNRIPYYGIHTWANNTQTALISGHLDPVDVFVLGHFHRPAYIEDAGGFVFMNGSMIGTNEFSLKRLHTTSEPSAWFFGLGYHPVKRLTFIYKMNTLSNQKEKDTLWN